MKKWIVLFLLIAAMVFAQEKKHSSTIKPDGWSLQFLIKNLNLSAFDGATFSAKKHWSAWNALRIGVTMEGDISSISIDQDKLPENYRRSILQQEDNASSFGITARGIFLHYSRPLRKVSFYVGGGPLLGFNYSKSKREMTQTIDDSTLGNVAEKNWGTGWKLGITSSIGVEWFVHAHIGLIGEYLPEIYYYYNKNTFEEIVTSKYVDSNQRINRKRKNYGFTLHNSVKFGVSIYF